MFVYIFDLFSLCCCNIIDPMFICINMHIIDGQQQRKRQEYLITYRIDSLTNTLNVSEGIASYVALIIVCSIALNSWQCSMLCYFILDFPSSTCVCILCL